MAKELEWGETVWDDMSREDMLLEIKRMYAALVAARSLVNMQRDTSSSYWTQGTGYQTKAMIDQVLDPISQEYDNNEPMFRGYFRYAQALLFDNLFPKWVICDTCGTMWRELELDTPLRTGECSKILMGVMHCPGTVRPATLDDIKPK